MIDDTTFVSNESLYSYSECKHLPLSCDKTNASCDPDNCVDWKKLTSSRHG